MVAVCPVDYFDNTLPPNPSFLSASWIAASSNRSFSALKVACLRSNSTFTSFAHGKEAIASRARGAHPTGQDMPVISTTTSFVFALAEAPALGPDSL